MIAESASDDLPQLVLCPLFIITPIIIANINMTENYYQAGAVHIEFKTDFEVI